MLYAVKFRNNKHGDGRALVVENLTGRCGELIGAPVGEVAVIEVNESLVGGGLVTLHDGTPAEDGLQHESRWVETYGDRKGIEYVAQNRAGLGALQVLYSWLLCTADHQLLYRDEPPYDVLSVDHSEMLPGSVGSWSQTSCRRMQITWSSTHSSPRQASGRPIGRRPRGPARGCLRDRFLAGRMKTVRVPVLHAKWPPFSLRKLELGPIRFESAWYKLFHGHEDEIVYCGCTLEDGTWVGGYLKSYSTEVQETADRELILVAPIRLRPAEMDTAVGFDPSAFVVSARRLMFLDVRYLEEGADFWEIERALDEANRQEQQGPEQSEGPTQ
jgi:Family of unknown function (DUF6338)